MGVLGRAFAQFRLEDEAADGGHLRTGVEALADFDKAVFTHTQFDMAGHETEGLSSTVWIASWGTVTLAW